MDNTRKASGQHSGRSATYRINVQSNGNLLIGSAYTKQLGVKPGDEFEINLGRKHIRLERVGVPIFRRHYGTALITVSEWC